MENKEKPQKSREEQSPEASFISIYKKFEFTYDDVEASLKKCSDKISQIGYIPQNDVIYNHENLRSITISKNSTNVKFFEAILAFGEYLIIAYTENQTQSVETSTKNLSNQLPSNLTKLKHQVIDILQTNFKNDSKANELVESFREKSNALDDHLKKSKTEKFDLKPLEEVIQKINELTKKIRPQAEVSKVMQDLNTTIDSIKKYLSNNLPVKERWIKTIEKNDLILKIEPDLTLPTKIPNDLSKNIFNGKTNSRALFSCLICAATGLLLSQHISSTNQSETFGTNWDDWFNRYFIPLSISFLSDIILVQHSICSSYVFPAFIETIANVFILSTFKNGMNTINKFIDNRSIPEHNEEFQQFLRLITTVSSLIPGSDFAEAFFYHSQRNNSKIIQMSTTFVSENLFFIYLDLLTSLIRSKDLAIEIFLVIYRSTSVNQIVHFTNFQNAIIGHAKDLLSCEIERHSLAERDVKGLESVMRLYSALWRYPANENDPIEYQMFNIDHDKQFMQTFTESLFSLIYSPIPASLKAECLNLLSSMPLNFWPQLETWPLITKENFENKDGIITDIHKIEAPDHIFNIPQAIAHFFTEQFNKGFLPKNEISIIQRLLYEEIFCYLASFDYIYPDTKWKIILELCKFWISAISAKYPLKNDRFKICESIFRTAIEKQDFISQLISFILEDAIPLEVMHSILKLFLLLLHYEKDFLLYSHQTSRPCTETLVNQISWNSDAVSKVLICATSYESNFQITCLQLIEYLCKFSPTIVQIFLTKPQAKAIQVCMNILNKKEPEIKNPNYNNIIYDNTNTNVRCFLLRIFINLGASSYFVRHVCGFDQHNPPQSIINSNLEKGIINKLMIMLCKPETHFNYPQLVDLSFQLILLECENSLTINSVLKILSESRQSFFITQLQYLRNPKSSIRAIGCMLQILSREAINTLNTSYGTTIKIFKELMEPEMNLHSDSIYYYVNEAKRTILLLDFVERINVNENSIWIAKGLNDIIIAYFNSKPAIDYMKEQPLQWNTIWCALLIQILEKIQTLISFNNNNKLIELTKPLSDSCAIIGKFIFNQNIFGYNMKEIENLLILILNDISYLSEINHTLSLIGIYSLLNSVISAMIKSNSNKFENLNKTIEILHQQIFNSIIRDSNSEYPILQSISLSSFESIIPFINNIQLVKFINLLIQSIDNDWDNFEKDPKLSSFNISSKCSLFTKFILNDHKIGKILIEEGIIKKLSNEHFWCKVVNYLRQLHENQIKMGILILQLLSTIELMYNQSEILHLQLLMLFNEYQTQIFNILDYSGNINMIGIEFLIEFTRFISAYPKSYIIDLKNLGFWNKFLFFFKRFANDAEWRIMIHGNVSDDVPKKVTELLTSALFLINRMSDIENILDNPLIGEEWRNNIKDKDKPLPLSMISSFCLQMMNKESDNELAHKAAIMCLLIVEKHCERWNNSVTHFDLGKMKQQATMFKGADFERLVSGDRSEKAILKKLIEFSNE